VANETSNFHLSSKNLRALRHKEANKQSLEVSFLSVFSNN